MNQLSYSAQFKRRIRSLDWSARDKRWPLIQQAHEVFDPLWRSGLMSRSRAYHLLARELDVPNWYAHFGKMHPSYLRQVPDAVAYITQSIHDYYRR